MPSLIFVAIIIVGAAALIYILFPMNNDLIPHIHIATGLRASLWDKSLFGAADALTREIAAQQAYQRSKAPMTQENTKLILIGTQSCALAMQVLRISWTKPLSPDAQVSIELAKQLLKSYGIELQSFPVEVPKPTEISWPPVNPQGRPYFSVLPDVYFDNYYHVREMFVVTNVDTQTGTMIDPEYQLVLKDAYWIEESLQWRMRFTCPNHKPGLDPFWVNHCKVRVGDEIPKDATP